MDKNAIKKYAVWARRELISRVSQKALQYGITEKEIVDANADSVNGRLLTAEEKNQRSALIKQVKENGYEQVMEEVAYTWFNRFCALRFMEVNGYLPSHIRVFSDDENNFKPQILTEAINLDLAGLNLEKIYKLKSEDKNEELYKYLLIVQCNALNSILPGMFQKISDYTELLFPDNLLREGSVIEQLVLQIPEADWKDAVQIIGWLYQYYNVEPKDKVFADLKKNIKITKDKIPAATQLFTPDWIVRYMVENSLGKLWIAGHPDSFTRGNWKYYIDEAEQEESVQKQLSSIRAEYVKIEPKDIKCIDPCMGSGHILVYMFDVLVQIYGDYGYNARDAVELIINNNIYGLDIDDRAAQLAYFAVMMKARQYDRRFFERGIQPQVYSIQESNNISLETFNYIIGNDIHLREELQKVFNVFHNAKEYGSVLQMPDIDFEALYKRFDEIYNEVSLFQREAVENVFPLVKQAELLAQKYDVVVTNPPYMGGRGMSDLLSDYIRQHYPISKSDMFSVFIEKCSQMCAKNRLYALITQPSILFLNSFEELRKQITKNDAIRSILHMGRGIFGIDFGSASFVVQKTEIPNYIGSYFKLHERTFQYIDPFDIERLFLSAKDNHSMTFNFANYTTDSDVDESNSIEDNSIENADEGLSHKEIKLYYETQQSNFLRLPGCPFAYWVGNKMIESFAETKLGDIANPRQGMATGENNRFLRLWHEVAITRCGFGMANREEAEQSRKKWFPYNKGGDFRKWYGNNEYLVNWENDGFEICNFKDSNGKLRSRPQNTQFYFRQSLTWSFVSSTSFGVRYSPIGSLFDIGGSSVFPQNNQLYYILGFLCSKLSFEYMRIQNPTMNFQVGNVANLPIIIDDEQKEIVETLVESSISISKTDWDSFETSWDFKKHPLI